jgi:predicted ATPase
VFFIRSLGFVTPTEARRISLEEAKRFEAVHEATYKAHGFDLIFVEPGTIAERAAAIRRAL